MYNRYKIQKGDTISSIAKKFNTSELRIMDLNNIPFVDLIKEGREIIVPKGKENYFEYYTIEKGDTIYGIAKKYNINPELLALLNGLNDNDYIYPNEEILIPKGNYSYYVTKEGDTLKTVSDKFGNTIEETVHNNETMYLMPGQLIVKRNRI